MDDAIERIVNELSASGQLGNTYLIFTSDNGFMQGQHRLHQGKFAPYEPSIQVPLLIRGPGIPAGQPRALVWNGDITSTILKIADAQPGLPQDGRSLLPYARDPSLPSTRPILIETGPPGATNEPGTPVSAASASPGSTSASTSRTSTRTTPPRSPAPSSRPRYRAIRTGRYLLVKYSDESRELYDLKRDPLELKSKYKDSRYFPVRQVPAEEAEGAGALPGRRLQPRHQEAPEAARQEEEALGQEAGAPTRTVDSRAMAASETPPPPFGDYYREIYAKGMLAGERPTLPIAWAELEERARESLDDRAIAYVFGGAGSEDTMRANLEAFRRWRIIPRVLSRTSPCGISPSSCSALRCRRRSC